MYRTSHGNARITFTALEERRRFKPAFKAHLSLLLVLNFPGVLQYHHGWVEVTLDTALGNLSLIVGLTGAAPHQAEIVAGLESKVRSSSHLDTYLQAIAKPGRTILHVHPHPCVIRPSPEQAGEEQLVRSSRGLSGGDYKVRLRRQVSLDSSGSDTAGCVA
ncbi:hypothetical protein JG687_00017446 [Phytophthora cactorum]|uniref:Uncharacterized protein n=1 Tax=Phytophthora cactorum TaxID=29920 RepID=A0A329RZG6_9STRA|nr:hypothetical protein PC115_g20624 [Phytophthora cactorum]KAG3004763.1 hypothetical protein PC120_g18345 [Phytophthora cactorum]KAG4047258.1 hypothetical protein PC123_g17373 [Phytophthora cactorum]KAG6945174.1 hypothetical protein JG687_00017446 [Phytophthora cactorum]RAW30083.1 hypothetical protein PC110_g13550 [Phytophthora cactorum]